MQSISWETLGWRKHKVESRLLGEISVTSVLQITLPLWQKVKWSEITQSCPTLCEPMNCSLPGSSIHGIFQAIVLEGVAISFSRGSSTPRDWPRVFHIVDRRFTIWATREVWKPLDDSEREEWKSWLKAQHSENEDHGIWSHQFMGNRWGNSGNSDRLYFCGCKIM